MKIENSLRSLHSLSRAFLQLVPVRLFGTGRQPTYMKRRREGGGYLLGACAKQGGRRRPQVEATDALVIQLTPCCQSVLAVMLAKAGGFGRFYLLLDLNQWLSPYESDTLTAESSRSSWVKSEKIDPYKRKPRNQSSPYYTRGGGGALRKRKRYHYTKWSSG